MNKKKEKVSSKEVGLEIGLVISRFLYKTEHLHYGYWPDDLAIIPENVRKAQDLHSKLIIDAIPANVETILDIGSGSGGLAEKLINKGYKVHCVSPSEYLADAIEEKLGDKVKVFRSTCQDLELEQQYDLVVFSESFQYVQVNQAIEKSIEALKPNNHLLICDFFRQPGTGRRPLGGGHGWDWFQNALKEYPLIEIINKDITKETARTMDLFNDMLNDVALPISSLSGRYMDSNFPKSMKLFRWAFRKHLTKINEIYFSGYLTSEMFNKMKTYRLLLYKLPS
ncbi:MAG: class I SAM-dependent methyltransferase [Candidatus Neomarinimicrobiota bacterium]|nr:class I SAM-dependent methyltransferase [Candidatus Neomarinimicrobiota bacterium]MED5434175.1 class I SAM-dependent methyltransferase [Candidatus Neomarinimicrobiota bacterium]